MVWDELQLWQKWVSKNGLLSYSFFETLATSQKTSIVVHKYVKRTRRYYRYYPPPVAIFNVTLAQTTNESRHSRMDQVKFMEDSL